MVATSHIEGEREEGGRRDIIAFRATRRNKYNISVLSSTVHPSNHEIIRKDLVLKNSLMNEYDDYNTVIITTYTIVININYFFEQQILFS